MVWKCEWDNNQCVSTRYTKLEPTGNSITQ